MAFEGKTILITGGCGGLGRAIAERFLKEGGRTVVCDVNEAAVAEFKEQVSSGHKDRTLVVKTDITSDAALDELFAKADESFGHIDFVVNNAGILDRFDPVGTVERELWDRVIAVNLTAPAMVSKRAVENFLRHDTKGAIVNIASISSLRGWTAGVAYTTSKHGLLGITKSTAAFYGPKGIRCNAILPGSMPTGITNNLAQGYSEEGMARQRFIFQDGAFTEIDPKAVAGLVLYLCSEDAVILNGGAFSADGGVAAC